MEHLTMGRKTNSEWRRWCLFCGRRLREFLFLGAWTTSSWALNHYIVDPLPVSGAPKYMLFAFEGIFNVCALTELLLLLFWPNKPRFLRWLAKKRDL
jgi:hypothetical protein